MGICALNLKWNDRCLTHYFLVLPDLPHYVYIGADILICLRAHVDMINEVIWAPMTSQSPTVPVNLENFLSGQTIPEACTLINEQETVVPAYTKGVAIRLTMRSNLQPHIGLLPAFTRVWGTGPHFGSHTPRCSDISGSVHPVQQLHGNGCQSA